MAQYRQSGLNLNGADHLAIGIRSSYKQPPRHHRRFKSSSSSTHRISIATVITFLCFLFAASSFAFLFLSSTHHRSDYDANNVHDDDFKNDFLNNVTRFTTSEVQFGHDSMTHVSDSTNWDQDDRRRDEDYNEEVVSRNSEDQNGKGHHTGKRKSPVKITNHDNKAINRHGLYNEAGRNELKMYEEKYEASLKVVGQSGVQTEGGNHVSDGGNSNMENEELGIDDEYDDGIDSHEPHLDEDDDVRHENEVNSESWKSLSTDGGDNAVKDLDAHEILVEGSLQDSSLKSYSSDNTAGKENHANVGDGKSKANSEKRPKKRKHRKFSSSRCEMKFLNSTAQLVEPLESRKFSRFSLSYIEKEARPDGVDHWEPRFAGHQSLREREDSFLAQDQKIHCGFVKGPAAHSSTGFDLAVDDVRYISKCHIAVISCIFGNSDRLRSPFVKSVSRLSRKNVCFVMFMDEITLQTLTAEGQEPDRMGFIGLWRVVVVKNLPFSDMRRVGKIPKLLSHRLFPSARYSIWLDSKLRLQRDPLLMLEYLLWRKNYEYAISNHYDRHCVWEEVDRNKKLNKFNHTLIDQQFGFYQADGLKRFNASDPNKMLPSNVPEGSMIVRAHTPMSNLFSCLWFNEVDRFTPRDQLSFAYTYQKLKNKNPDKPFYLHMFKDCERRQIAKLFHHRSPEKRIVPEDVAG